MRKKLAIVGAHPDTRSDAPWLDESFDIWLVNEWANTDWCKRWDALLQLHKPKYYRSPNNENDPNHWNWLQREHEGKIIYMQAADPLVPNSVAYPLEEVNAELLAGLTYKGMAVENYKSSVAYAIALAVYQGYEQIDLYGVEMEHISEYHSQQPNMSFWVGVAIGRGVKVDLHCTRRLFDGWSYGYEETPAERKYISLIAGMNMQLSEVERQQAQLQGAIAIVTQLMQEDDEQ